MNHTPDRLYELLPAIYRLRDAEQGHPLRELLRIVGEQAQVLEDDIAQLYDSWFIERCPDWAVPYLGELVGYRPVQAAGLPENVTNNRLSRVLVPRREVANTIAYRRRKGTLALLEQLARDVADWPARAVEFGPLLVQTQALNHLHIERGQTMNMRDSDALERLGGPFDSSAHTVDVRRVSAPALQGRYNLPSIGLFVWRLRSFALTRTRPRRLVQQPNCFTFSPLGNNTPLYTNPQAEQSADAIAGELNVPTIIRRRALADHLQAYYGPGKSLCLYDGSEPVSVERIVVADLSGWRREPRGEQVLLDPLLGRFVFPPRRMPKDPQVSYHYGFSAAIGGGEYDRPLPEDPGARSYGYYPVSSRAAGRQEINAALRHWRRERPRHAVIEIVDSGVYIEPISIELEEHQSLELRAAPGCRPVIRLVEVESAIADLRVTGAAQSCFSLDGVLVVGYGVRVEGDLATITISHSTLVPGWDLDEHCTPSSVDQPSLRLLDAPLADEAYQAPITPTGRSIGTRLVIEKSIIGSLLITRDEVGKEPLEITITDSILDATGPGREALSAPGCGFAHATLTIRRSTVFGEILTHAIALAENSIFTGEVRAARRQYGCIRFCSLPPGSRTPRRYHCQPDLAIEQAVAGLSTLTEQATARREAAEHVRPHFASEHYGTPTYARLTRANDAAITRGADDEAELGVFHDLFEPQRAANLQARLDEYMPAGYDTGIIYAS